MVISKRNRPVPNDSRETENKYPHSAISTNDYLAPLLHVFQLHIYSCFFVNDAVCVCVCVCACARARVLVRSF
jgi:hypothetical protein